MTLWTELVVQPASLSIAKLNTYRQLSRTMAQYFKKTKIITTVTQMQSFTANSVKLKKTDIKTKYIYSSIEIE